MADHALAREYHDVYAEQPKRLNPEAVAALKRVHAAGARQSIVSALRQDLLEAALDEFGVRGFFAHVCGVDNLDGLSKIDRAKELFALVRTEDSAADIVIIGDALHDKEVADALGVRCVLCAQGSHAAWRLRAVAPTGDTLMEALDLALGKGP